MSSQNTPWICAAILASVLHLSLLALGIYWKAPPSRSKPQNKIVVQMIELRPHLTQASYDEIASINTKLEHQKPVLKKIETKQLQPKKILPIKKVVEQPKKIVSNPKKENGIKKSQQQKDNPKIAESQAKQQKLHQQEVKQKEELLAQNLKKINESRGKLNATSLPTDAKSTSSPQPVGHLAVDSSKLGNRQAGIVEINYRENVGRLLKLALRLPEYGTVKIKLTLDKTGKVLKVEIIESESLKNKTYVENEIPKHIFPSFGNQFTEPSQSFLYTLKNE